MRLLDRLRGIEQIPYSRERSGNRESSTTPCPHGGAWWGDNWWMKLHAIGERVPAKVGTNVCALCLFHIGTETEHVECRFLLASQKTVNRLIRKAIKETDE